MEIYTCFQHNFKYSRYNHLHFRKFSWTQRHDFAEKRKTWFCGTLLGIPSQTNIILPLLLFLSSLKVSTKPSTRNWDAENPISSFVSVIAGMSTYFKTNSFNWSNLFGSDFMFKFPIIALFVFFILTFQFEIKNLKMYFNGIARGFIIQAIPELLLPYTLFTDSK